MSRGLGHWQRRILDYLERTKEPVSAVDLLTDGLGLELPIERSLHSAILRAASSLEKRGLLCKSGGGYRYGCNAYWLPGHPPGKIQRKLPLSVMKHRVLKALADGEKTYAAVASEILHEADLGEHIRTSISRAVRALESEGTIRRYWGDDWGRRVVFLNVARKDKVASVQPLPEGKARRKGA
jgi:DNA-binding MarR family transcriptional regulator